MCGIVGIISDHSDEAANDMAVALEGLRHRGSDSVGALIYYDDILQNSVRGRKVDPKLLDQIRLMGPSKNTNGTTIGFGHTRYTTSKGKNLALNSQPYIVAHDDIQMELLFNGNIPNHEKIRRDYLQGYTFSTHGDTETLSRFMLHCIEEILMHPGQSTVQYAIQETVKKVLDIFPGGYSVIAKFHNEVFAFKDIYGIRPLAFGTKKGSHIFASEDHFFPQSDYDYQGEVPHGSLIFAGEEPKTLYNTITQHPDVFEFVYLAKDNSCLYGVNNARVRFDLGFSAAQELMRHHPDWQFDTIVAVPNGANIMRIGACQALGLDAYIPNLMTRKVYSERSFMASEQHDREKIVREKFTIDTNQIRDKRVLLIDDSIVRGTTMHVIVDMLLENGAASVDVLSSSPIVHFGDRYGIAMSTNELVGIDHTDARRLTCEEIEMKLFYDALAGKQRARLFYPSVENFLGVFQKHGLLNVHAAYFDGKFING